MKVFVTGASGFIGSAVVKELIGAGHQVLGLARSEASAKALIEAGAGVLPGSLEDRQSLQQGALVADGIIHTAFIHDFNRYGEAAETDKQAIEAMGNVLKGTTKPLLVTGGLLGLRNDGNNTTEADPAPAHPRASEAAAMALAQGGIHASVIRLPPSVHDRGDKGFVPFIISKAREKVCRRMLGMA